MATKKKMLQAAAGNAGGEALNVEDVFSTYLWDGDGSTRTITNNIDLDGEGGLVWYKGRDTGGLGASQRHSLYDTERGATQRLISNNTNAEATESTALTAFTSTGFTIGADAETNQSGYDYASWTFRKAPKFFDVVTYTGDGTDARQISHSLGATVGSIFVKNTSSGSTEWMVYHRSLSNDLPNHSLSLVLNQTYEQLSWKAFGEHATQTSSVFTLGTNSPNEFFVNQSGQTYVAYLFAHNDGDGEFGPDGDADIIKCGSYTGNGSTDGPEIDLGFEPQWLLFKGVSNASNWYIYDVMRGIPVGGDPSALYPGASEAEQSASWGHIALSATGFKIEGTHPDFNTSGNTYTYIAIRRGTKVPESATEVFDVTTQGAVDNNDPGFKTDWPVDFAIRTDTDGANNLTGSRLTGIGKMYTDGDNSENTSDPDMVWDFNNGWWGNSTTDSTKIAWMWKRAPKFFDVVAYTGDGTAGRTVSHNLGVAPEMIWVKARNQTYGGFIYHVGIGEDKALILFNGIYNVNAAETYAAWNNTAPNSSDFTLGNFTNVNNSGDDFIAYLFASLDGVSKVGSYTGNGSTLNIDCGFTSGARFVLIKTVSTSGSWYVLDTARGIVAGNDPVLSLNTTNPEEAFDDLIDPYSAGFTLNGVGMVNANNVEYIFYAVA